MSDTSAPQAVVSSKPLTLAAHAAFVPIGIVTVLLSPLLPTLSVQWALNYRQAGSLITAQYLGSTIGVGLSSILISRWGFRFAIKSGLFVMAVGVAALVAGSRFTGMACIAGYGLGIGLAVPACNLLVAEVNPGRRSAALNLLNFSWSAGAVASPFLISAAVRLQHLTMFLEIIAAVSLLVVVGVAAMPSSIQEPLVPTGAAGAIPWKSQSLAVLASLFFLYVGVENGFGLWSASYASSLGTMSQAMALTMPSFFYSALMLGRWAAPFVLKRFEEIRVAQGGLLLACAGMAGLVASHSLIAVATSASVAGLGLAAVYPITISLLNREFGAVASRIGSVMFTSANLGGSLLPWLVGASSNQFHTLKAGLAVPLIGGAAMLLLYQRKWRAVSASLSD
jgi:MFS transporter, FHS family, glucose/mannose:H+ symporter